MNRFKVFNPETRTYEDTRPHLSQSEVNNEFAYRQAKAKLETLLTSDDFIYPLFHFLQGEGYRLSSINKDNVMAFVAMALEKRADNKENNQ